FNKLRKTKLFRPLVEKLEKRAMGKSGKIQKAEFWGLLLFVGIPLPGTGAWTGSLIAAMLEINKKKAFLAIVCGVILAMVIMSVITYVIPWVVAWIAAR
ncbi:MAG TPA: small multi-drug export protein, partial [Lachnospiraceae bacterium]|nr:small multi-drug export protein [Lachnospiraceae bacterium]